MNVSGDVSFIPSFVTFAVISHKSLTSLVPLLKNLDNKLTYLTLLLWITYEVTHSHNG